MNKRKKDIRLFINTIEKSIIEFLKKYNIKAYSDRKNIGIWVKNKKISAIGVRVKNWIAYHGCSININNNLSIIKRLSHVDLIIKWLLHLKTWVSKSQRI